MANERTARENDTAPGSSARSARAQKTGLNTVSAEMILERVPPFDEAAEVGVLGSMLIDSRAADIAIEELTDTDFYKPRHQTLFKVFRELFQKHENLDELFVCSELEQRGLLDKIGGKEMVGKLIMDTPSAASVENYCRLVRDRAVERELIEGAGKILQMVNAPSAEESGTLVEAAEKIVFDISDRRTGDDAVPMIQLMEQALGEAAEVQAARRDGREPEIPAIATKFSELDRLLSGGLWPGELIIVAGRPSMGKTTFAINVARHIAVGNENQVKGVAIFSLEMPREQVAKNILCAAAELQGHKMRRYDFNEEEFERAKFFGKVLQQAPIFIDDTSGLTISQMRARCRRLRHRHDVRLVIVDYLQLMKAGGGGKKDNREQEVAEISRSLKSIARDLRIPIIVLSQLNRSAEKRDNEDKRPQMSDLRESGSIEQDADVIIMLYRPEYYNIEGNAKNINVGEALVLKNRNGPVGSVKLTFLKDILRFESYAPEHDAAGS